MGKLRFVGVVMIAALVCNLAQGEVCELVNGSFEYDGLISDIEVNEPNGWDDVNLPTGLFYGYVGTDWVTDANYNLTVYSQWYEDFEVNDTATVSQEVCFTGFNAIIFDLKLEKYLYSQWDPSKCSAVLLIDGAVVWESNDVGPDVAGEYYDQLYIIDGIEEGMHKLSLGLRVNVSETLDDFYITHWDFIEFGDLPCDGYGYLLEDFSEDCYVNMKDLKMLADEWLKPVEPDNKYNLFGDDTVIDFRDFAIFADAWLSSSYD